MASVGYIRVSSVAQNTERQLATLQLDRVFEDKLSGKDANRPALKDMIAYVREGDVVYVHSIDRLARNLVDLKQIVQTLNGKKVQVQFVKEGLTFSPDTDNPMNNLMLSMMGAFAEFERQLIRERQLEGHAARKAKGLTTGRPEALKPEQIAAIKQRATESKVALASEYGVSRATIYAALKA